MTFTWMPNWLRRRGVSSTVNRRFRPEVVPLEDRVVPSATEINESEFNNIPAFADNLPVADGLVVANGAISVAGDVDYYKFTVSANQRVWAYVDTGAPAGPSEDAVLTLFDTDGTTQIEMDDDDGTGNGGDGTTENGLAPLIAGRSFPLGSPGTYYLKVQEYNNDAVLSPYKLYVRLTNHGLLPLSTLESEPNDSRTFANPISTTDGSRLRIGSIGDAGDVDWYSFFARTGDRVFIAADGDPERDGTGPNLVLDLVTGGFFPQTLITVDSSPDSTATDPAAEGFSYLFSATGTYYVKVTGDGTTGSYHLQVTGNSHPGTLQFGTSTYVGSEAGGSVAVTVLRTGGADGMVSVNYAANGGSASPGSDYTPVGGTLTFADGETSKTIVIPVHSDPYVEGAETISLTLSQPTNGAVLGSRTTATAIIQDSTTPPVRDVTPMVMVTRTRVRSKRRTKRYREMVTVRNIAGMGLHGPVMLVVSGLRKKVRLLGASGVAQKMAGSPYVTVTPGPLAPGEAVSFLLTFSNPRKGRVNYLTQVLAGTGPV